MKKKTEYILFPPGYGLPIGHYKTMKQVKKCLRRNKEKWIYVKKWITTKSHKQSFLSWSQHYKYLGENVKRI